MRTWFAAIAFLTITRFAFAGADESAPSQASLIVCTGLGGSSEYADAFAHWAENWRKAGMAGGARLTMIGADTDQGEDLPRLRSTLQAEPVAGIEPLWLVLLGHGTYDGRDAKFNLRGSDLTAGELSAILAPFQRPVIVVAAFSSSGAFLAPLSKSGRVVITATKSGGESNFSRFGKYLSEAIADPSADLDHDGQTSLLEAWVSATQQTAEFYKSEGRLATEHSLLDDNGDGKGTPADWYNGLRVVKKATGGIPDGLRAGQIHLVPSAAERELPRALRAERDTLELDLAQLRESKAALPEDEYFQKLETLLLRLAKLYEGAPKQHPE
jgi:hypothetical protein